MSGLASWLLSAFTWLLDGAWNVFAGLVNAIIVAFCSFFSMVVNLLPTTQVTAPDPISSDPTFLSTLNWFIPVNHMVVSLGVYIAAMLLYFGLGPLLRFFKIIH